MAEGTIRGKAQLLGILQRSISTNGIGVTVAIESGRISAPEAMYSMAVVVANVVARALLTLSVVKVG